MENSNYSTRTRIEINLYLEPLLVGDLRDAQPALVGDVLAQSHVPVHRDGGGHPKRRILLPARKRREYKAVNPWQILVLIIVVKI